MATAKSNGKSAAAFRTISEVAEELDVPQHVLRFWESKFAQVKPLKRGGGRRYYRPEDVELLRKIRDLLYQDGYTIKGVQKLLREGAHRKLADLTPSTEPVPIIAAVTKAAQRGGAAAETNPRAEAAPAAPSSTAGGVRDRLTGVLIELRALKKLLDEPA
jgi:DNA-binding transcriptional MerR regulator